VLAGESGRFEAVSDQGLATGVIGRDRAATDQRLGEF
jgi:hypothetical protein